MTDTQRTQTDLLTNLFQDGQDAKEITPQDLRDLIVSMAPAIGGCYVSTPAATTISSANTDVKAGGTTTLLTPTAKNFTMPANNRLLYGGTPTRHFLVACTATIQAATTSGVEIGLGIAKDGTFIQETQVIADNQVATEAVNLVSFGIVELATSSYLEAFISNETDTDNLTVNQMTILAASLFI